MVGGPIICAWYRASVSNISPVFCPRFVSYFSNRISFCEIVERGVEHFSATHYNSACARSWKQFPVPEAVLSIQFQTVSHWVGRRGIATVVYFAFAIFLPFRVPLVEIDWIWFPTDEGFSYSRARVTCGDIVCRGSWSVPDGGYYWEVGFSGRTLLAVSGSGKVVFMKTIVVLCMLLFIHICSWSNCF